MGQGQILKLNEFFIEGENQELSHVLLHIIQPSTPEEEHDRGYFFAICEINRGSKEDIYHLQRIIDEIENGYYEIGEHKNKNSLEIILEKINQDNSAVFGSGTALNCVVGAICRNEIVFAYHGVPEILLFYKNKKSIYQKMELISAAEENDGDADKLFPQIVQGKINPNDYLFLGTARIHDYFNHDRLQKIVTTRVPERSAEHLEKVLSEIKNGLSFGGIIINITKKTTAGQGRKKADKSITAKEHISPKKINPLFTTEQDTARTLSPSLLPKINNKIKSLISAYRKKRTVLNQQEIPVNEAENYAPAQINATHLRQHKPMARQKNQTRKEHLKQVSTIWQFLKKIFKYIGLALWGAGFWLARFLFKIGRNLIMLIIVCTNFKNRRQEILDEWSESRDKFVDTFKRLPLLTKILGIIALAVAIIFSASLLYLQINKNRMAEKQRYRDTLQMIKNQTDAADSAMIYADLITALKEADAATKLLNDFVCAPNDKETCAQINDRLKAVMASARKMYSVTPQMLIDWGVFGCNNINKLFKINNKAVGFSSTTSTICVYNLMTKENKTVSPPEKEISNFIAAAVPKENDYALLIYNKTKAVIFNPQDNSLKKAELTLPTADADINAVIIYNRRLYSLDTFNNRLYRHDNVKDGFDMGKDWLEDTSLNLRDGTDITVDGDLYVLKTNGEIYKFTRGRRVDFNLQGLDPLLTTGTGMQTYTDWENIYILDSQEKRIIITDNAGKLIKQLKLEGLANLSDMVVEESAGTAYVVNNGRLYQVDLQ